MKIGFIGNGNMANAIITRLRTHKHFDLYVSGIDFAEVSAYAAELEITAIDGNSALAAEVDVVVLAVKPNIVPLVLAEIDVKDKLLITIAAGLSLSSYPDSAVVRVMPNLNARIARAVSAIVANGFVDEAQLAVAKEIVSSIGSVYEIPEKDFSTFTAIAGSSPAFVFEFIDAMSRAALSHGMPKALATEIAANAVAGSAELLAFEHANPWDLINQVSSPGGTTVAGSRALHENGFYNTVMQAIDAVIERDQELGS
ncbi:MAG: pyrroline-5-carboxylate reductase [Lactobacillales bacterium]|jgi:pyrroline-5-carboxylate reductase|nr:pyrroline-5-carboxylate reductase [Lactobacillales bacterium]